MPLGPPPSPATLARLPSVRLRGRIAHRVFRADRTGAWWFSSVVDGDDPESRGRFDLPAPLGSCYLALSAVGAVLEVFQHFGAGLLPAVELEVRRRVEVVIPASAPAAANLSAQRARGLGATASLWAGGTRALTQAWAAGLHRAGWRAAHHGVAHDPAGRLRAITLFDTAGQHPPYDDAAGWSGQVHTMHDDQRLASRLRRYGIEVGRSDVQLPLVRLDDLPGGIPKR